MPVRAIGLQHVQISVEPDHLEKARDFYIRLLGMEQIHDPFGKGGYWVGAGDQSIHIRCEPGIERSKTRAHPALIIDNLDTCRKELEAESYQIIPQPKIDGYDRFHTFDPSGNRVEIMQRTP